MYLWFWEWNMFGAIDPGQHSHGTFDNAIRVANDRQSAEIATEYGLHLSLEVGPYGVDVDLETTNSSTRDWSELASIIPCFNPGPPGSQTQQFLTSKTSFVSPLGFESLEAREIHFNETLRARVACAQDPKGRYPWSDKWPASQTEARHGLLARESSDSRWVTGITWDRFLSVQGNNPWSCMHAAARIGPLAAKETRNVHGRIYLLPGTKEDILAADSQ